VHTRKSTVIHCVIVGLTSQCTALSKGVELQVK
jgi:hypothetical protein